MTKAPQGRGLYRAKVANQHHRVTFVELFFDLVFVFAITQVSHALTEHYSLAGAGQALFLLFAVWWVWIYTSWAMNWLNPDHTAIRLMLFVLMLAGLLVSVSIPEAFGHRGLTFGLAYAFMQVSRTIVICLAIPKSKKGESRNFRRILVWLCVSALFWIAGAFSHGETRIALWIVALGLEVIGPFAMYWTPGLGVSSVRDWNIEGGHMAERCGLFIIIVLGESILITGSTFAKQAMTQTSVAAFLVAFTGSLAMWWIYFDKGATLGEQQITHAADPGRLGRLAYTYMHLPIVAGLVVAAVADDFLLAHPVQKAELPSALSIVGGPALFLAGVVGFKCCLRGWLQLSHLVGLAAFAVLFIVARYWVAMAQIELAAWAVAILIVVSVWERLSLTGVIGWPRKGRA